MNTPRVLVDCRSSGVADLRQQWWARGLFTLFVLAPFGACTNLSIRAVWATREATEPMSGAVHPGGVVGIACDDWCAVYLAVDRPLEDVAHTYDRLYFVVRPCGGEDRDEIWSGRVFAASDAERRQFSEFSHLYKVYVPLDSGMMRRHAGYIWGLDPDALVKQAAESGFCCRLGGGNMMGGRLSSNEVRLPLAVEGDTVVLLAASPVMGM